MHHSQRLGHVIKRLRQMALGGSSAAELLDFATSHSPPGTFKAFDNIKDAFLLRGVSPLMLRPPTTPETEASWQELIQKHRAEWERAPIPELMRLRDYLAFMRFSQEANLFVIVCAANPSTGRWIGQRGVRCYGGRVPIPVSQDSSYEGLLVANPADPRIATIQRAFGDEPSYDGYLRRLAEQGLRVLGEDAGYLVADANGNRLHESYRLHSVYDAQTYQPVWNQQTGERLREALNNQLGDELVKFGPHDEWEFRNDQKVAGPAWGPQLPAIQFDQKQSIQPVLTTVDLAQVFGIKQRWADLYPHHPGK